METKESSPEKMKPRLLTATALTNIPLNTKTSNILQRDKLGYPYIPGELLAKQFTHSVKTTDLYPVLYPMLNKEKGITYTTTQYLFSITKTFLELAGYKVEALEKPIGKPPSQAGEAGVKCVTIQYRDVVDTIVTQDIFDELNPLYGRIGFKANVCVLREEESSIIKDLELIPYGTAFLGVVYDGVFDGEEGVLRLDSGKLILIKYKIL